MIAENVSKLKERINFKCKEVNRDPSEIKVVAVSKYFGTDAIEEAHNAGVSDFGENKAQELNHKFEKLGEKVTWHFVGTLQKNKVKYVVKAARFIHSVDSPELAVEIDKRAKMLGKVQDVLIQYKTSYEESKSGVRDEELLYNLAEQCSELNNINLIGLMTIAPLTDEEEVIRKSFRELRMLKDKLNDKGYTLKELSMGMTGDYEIAIEEGATILRIGTAIFGQRDYSKDWKEL